jgi:mono/diheme cytochrome c family protein
MGERPLAVVLAVALSATPGAVVAQDAAGGAAVFEQNCAVCHNHEGVGNPGLAPPLAGRQWTALLRDRNYLPAVLLHGLIGPIDVAGQYYAGAMAPQSALTDQELASVANYVTRTLNGAALPPDWRDFDSGEIASMRSMALASGDQHRLRQRLSAE